LSDYDITTDLLPKPYLQAFFELALRGVTIDSAAVKEAAFGFFSNIANLLRADFSPFLQYVMPPLFESCESHAGIEKKGEMR